MLYLNTLSLNKHHKDLVSLLASIGRSFYVIGYSETWLNDRTYVDILILNGYELYRRNRLGRLSCGLSLYVDSRHSINICNDLIIKDGPSDSLFIEINVSNGKNLIVGVIYQPPNSDFDI